MIAVKPVSVDAGLVLSVNLCGTSFSVLMLQFAALPKVRIRDVPDEARSGSSTFN